MELIAMPPKLSVCVMTYNQEEYIQQCLQSIVDQITDFTFEVIVGDDCSTDGTAAIIQKFANEYPLIVIPVFQKINTGGPGNYFAIQRVAKGEFVAHLDGDDYWLPGKLQNQVNFLCQRPQCVAVYSNALIINDKDEIFGVFNNTLPSVFDLNYLLSEGNFLNHSSMMYRAVIKKAILAIEGPCIDYRIHLRLAQHGLLGYTNQAHVAYRVGSTTSMISNQHEKVRRFYLAALEDVPNDNNNIKAKRSSLAKFYWGELSLLIRRGHFAAGFTLINSIRNTTPRGTIFYIVLRSFNGFLSRLRKVICSNSSTLKIYHPR